MFLSIQQKFILDALKKLICIRQRQIHILVQGRFEADGVKITNAQPDARRLEAIDVMLALTGGRPQEFRVSREPPRLLCFAYGGDGLRPFTVASLDAAPAELLERGRAERIVWIADSGQPPQGLVLPPKHFFAARQPDGSHRFYGSNGP